MCSCKLCSYRDESLTSALPRSSEGIASEPRSTGKETQRRAILRPLHRGPTCGRIRGIASNAGREAMGCEGVERNQAVTHLAAPSDGRSRSHNPFRFNVAWSKFDSLSDQPPVTHV